MSEFEPGGVGGGWLGTYAYKGTARDRPPVRFEATLTEPDGEGAFSGTILDDGRLGEAAVSGGQSGRGIRFTKTYRRRGLAAIFYEGTLTEDGRTMAGTWRIAGDVHGVWDARRTWSLSERDAAEAEEWVEEWVEERAREVVRLG